MLQHDWIKMHITADRRSLLGFLVYTYAGLVVWNLLFFLLYLEMRIELLFMDFSTIFALSNIFAAMWFSVILISILVLKRLLFIGIFLVAILLTTNDLFTVVVPVLFGLYLPDSLIENLFWVGFIASVTCLALAFRFHGSLKLERNASGLLSPVPRMDPEPDTSPLVDLFEHLGTNRTRQIIEFERRAQALLRRSNFVLYTIIGVLVFAALFIVFAGYIAELGTNKRDVIADMQLEKTKIIEKIESIIQKQTEFRTATTAAASSFASSVTQILDLTKTPSLAKATTEDNDVLSLVANHVEELGTQGKQVQSLFTNLERYDKRYAAVADAFREELGRLSTNLDEIRKIWAENMAGGRAVQSGQAVAFTDPNLLVAAGVTRFGVLIVSIYLVQILINLYRYNTRLAAFYRAQADALVLLELDAKQVKSAQRNFLPELDYGKVPATLPERIAAAATAGATKVHNRARAIRRRPRSRAAAMT